MVLEQFELSIQLMPALRADGRHGLDGIAFSDSFRGSCLRLMPDRPPLSDEDRASLHLLGNAGEIDAISPTTDKAWQAPIQGQVLPERTALDERHLWELSPDDIDGDHTN